MSADSRTGDVDCLLGIVTRRDIGAVVIAQHGAKCMDDRWARKGASP